MSNEYTSTNSIPLWDEDSFCKMASLITDITEMRTTVFDLAIKPKSYEELTKELQKSAVSFISNTSEDVIICLCDCWMKDFEQQSDDGEKRRNIYRNWRNYIEK